MHVEISKSLSYAILTSAFAADLLAHGSAAQATSIVRLPTVDLTVSRNQPTPVSFRALPDARCEIGAGAQLPLTVYADDNGNVRFNATPKPNGPSALTVTAACEGAGRRVSLSLRFRAVAGAVHNAAPPIVADRSFTQSRGFDPASASDQDLQRYGYPPRPDRSATPAAYAAWLHAMQVPTIRVAPTGVLRTDRIEGPAHDNGNATSGNWSGLVDYGQNGQYSEVFGLWDVPFVSTTQSASPSYSSMWEGIDGWNSSDVVQDGTEQDAVDVLGFALSFYYAWYEFWPDQGSTSFANFSVNPGDTMFGQSWSCTVNGHLSGCYFIEDETQNESATATEEAQQPGLYKGNNAEWVLERPRVNGSLHDLPFYGFVLPYSMFAYDATKRAFEAYASERYTGVTMVNGSDDLSVGMYSSQTAGAIFWLNYQ